jgi:hypothetical protein
MPLAKLLDQALSSYLSGLIAASSKFFCRKPLNTRGTGSTRFAREGEAKQWQQNQL